jgi:hemerythrin-like domain-containing protein
MPGPLRSLVFVHTALRNELNEFAHLAHAVARSENDIEALKERFDWATYALHYHAAGEDAALFPAIEAKYPGVAMTFDDDHQTDDALVAEMKQLLEGTNAQNNLSRIARLADQLADRASLHMDKEERLLVPFVEEHFSMEEQGAILGGMMQAFPPEFMAKGVPWIFSHLDESLRISYATALKGAMPAEPFAMHMSNVEKQLGSDEWAPIAVAIE